MRRLTTLAKVSANYMSRTTGPPAPSLPKRGNEIAKPGQIAPREREGLRQSAAPRRTAGASVKSVLAIVNGPFGVVFDREKGTARPPLTP
jgi:hypothetical protein